jgi:hypothetical protein
MSEYLIESHFMQPYQTIEDICAALAARPDAWAKVCEGQSYVPLLLLLEHSYPTVVAQLADHLVAAGLARAEAERVSLRRLVVFALSAPIGRSWGEHAVSWIEAGFPIDDEIASALEQVAKDKRYQQRVRHRAFAAAKRWRRAHGGSS